MNESANSIANLDQMLWVADYPTLGAQRAADRQAIVADDVTLSYGELNTQSDRFGQNLVQRGLSAGDRIAYIGKNSGLFFPVFFACLRKGVILVPINWRCAAPEIAFILQDSRSRLVIHDAELEGTILLAVEGLDSVPDLLPVTGESTSLRNVLLSGVATPSAARVEHPDDCALLMYTSGTTGHPKGVTLSHRALSIARHVERDLPAWSDWTDEDVILSAMPNFHVGGLSWMLIGLMRTLTCVLTANAGPSNLLRLAREHDVTRTFLVPTIVRALLEEITSNGSEAPRFKTIFYGASPMDVPLVTRCIEVFGCGFAQYYGMTENCGTVTFLPPTAHDVKRPELLRSVGQVLPGMRIEIRDAQRMTVKPGASGEIWVKSPTLMNGYWQRPDATEEALISGWYRTGDGGYLDKDGYLYLTDRIKDMIISGGENIYPIEVEQALRQHPAVRDVVVVGVPDPTWGQAIAAVVEWHEGRSASLDELREFLRKYLAGYKLPKFLKSFDTLPRTATGKLKRSEVRSSVAESLRN